MDNEKDHDKVNIDFSKSVTSPEIHIPEIHDWDDPYWKEKTPIALVVHALAQKHHDVEENHLSKRKEIISDIAPAAVGAYEQDPILLAFTALASVIIYGLHTQAKTSEIEYDELLKIWAEYKNNCNDPEFGSSKEERRKSAENIVKDRIYEMNIKLTDISISDTIELNNIMAEAEKRAIKRKWIPHKKVTAQDVENMDGRLKKIANKYKKTIADNIISPFLDAIYLYSEVTKSCFSDLKSPKKAFDGVVDGINTSKDVFNGRKETKTRRKQREQHKDKVTFIKTRTKTLPKSTIVEGKIDYDSAKRYSDIIKNIEAYNPEQKLTLTSFAFASGLAGVGAVGLGINSVEAAIVTNGLQENILQIGAGIWGLALGIGAWGQTGKVSQHYHHALNSERALAAKEHEAIARAYDSLVEISKNNKKPSKTYALPLNWRSERADISIIPNQYDNTPP